MARRIGREATFEAGFQNSTVFLMALPHYKSRLTIDAERIPLKGIMPIAVVRRGEGVVVNHSILFTRTARGEEAIILGVVSSLHHV